MEITGMKHVVIERSLADLLNGALKTNQVLGDKLDSEIQTLNTVHSIESMERF